MTSEEARELLRKAIFSAATLIQNDPEVDEDTRELVSSDLALAEEAILALVKNEEGSP